MTCNKHRLTEAENVEVAYCAECRKYIMTFKDAEGHAMATWHLDEEHMRAMVSVLFNRGEIVMETRS